MVGGHIRLPGLNCLTSGTQKDLAFLACGLGKVESVHNHLTMGAASSAEFKLWNS